MGSSRLKEDIDPLGLAVIHAGKIGMRRPTGDVAKLPLPELLPQTINLTGKTHVSIANISKLGEDAASKYVLCFVDDARCERVARSPWKYGEVLRSAYAIATPDLSVYPDMAIEEQFLNVYWSRLVGRIWQEQGILVIPTIAWGDERSYSFCFRSTPPINTLAVSTLGTRRNQQMLISGLSKLCATPRLNLVLYDGQLDGYFKNKLNIANIISVEHDLKKASRLVKTKPLLNQLQLGYV